MAIYPDLHTRLASFPGKGFFSFGRRDTSPPRKPTGGNRWADVAPREIVIHKRHEPAPVNPWVCNPGAYRAGS